MSEALAVPPPRPGPLAAIAERARGIWGARELMYEFALRDVRIRYRQAVLGVLWALLMPTLTIGASMVVRIVALRHATGLAPVSNEAAIAGVALKAVCWAFFAGAIGTATSSLASNAGLVSRVYFPREILPLSSVLAQCVDFAMGALGAIVIVAVLGVDLAWTVLWAPVLVAMLVLLTASLAAVLACANLFFRDVRYIIQVFLTFGLFFTPVFVTVEQLGGRLSRVAMLNPVAPLLEGLRLAVVGQHDLLQPLAVANGAVVWQPWYLAYSAGVAAVAAVGAALLYARLELSFAERL